MSDDKKTGDDTVGRPQAFEFAFLSPLYRDLATLDVDYIGQLTGVFAFNFDMHCIYCGRESTFNVKSTFTGNPSNDFILKPRHHTLTATCTRASHSYTSYIRFSGKRLYKVGQYPSIEDIAGADIRKYQSLLKDGYFGELVRATGLASHGIGIGSFVYLRRIFEKLIWDHYAEFVATHGDIDNFATMWMSDKIDALKSVLPVALVETRATYAILSKGIHELSEDECKIYFPVVRAAIINMLEDDFQEAEKAKAAKAIRDQVAAIAGKLKS